MNSIEHNLSVIKQRIATACERSGRDVGDVKLLLATKTVPAERIQTAIELGSNLLGENKVQELKEKAPMLNESELDFNYHFIGHLQSNKIKDVVKYASCIQSVDRLSLAKKLQKRLELEDKTIDVFIQVNTSREESKFGCAPEDTLELVKQVALLDRMNIKGLMTIGLFSANEDEVRPCFQILKKLQQEIHTLNLDNVDPKELSMGMSGDLEIAIEEGATIIRVGTAVFGERQYPDSYYWNEKKPT